MGKNKTLKIIGYIVVFALIFNLVSPLFDTKTHAYENSSKRIEQELKKIVSKYGEANVVFDDGMYIYIGEEIDLVDSEKYQGVIWNSENEEIVKVENNKLTGIKEGTTFIVGKKDETYYIKEVYSSMKSVNVRSINNLESRANSQYVVYIDPGHGGYDPGTQGNGIVEKDIVLNYGLRLKGKLEANGIKVIMSRTSDVYVSLEDRSKGANNVNPDIFISIHINSAGATSASGIETFYKKDIDKPLAESIQNKLISYTGAVDRGAKWEDFHVVRETNMPASLVECGFLTNVNEANNLKSWNYQEKLINAMLDGALDYLYNSNPLVANRIYGSNRYETSYELFKNGWSSSEYAVIAPGLDYPDALCATPLATKYNAPIVLAENTSLKNQQTLLNLLKSKGVKTVFLVGGTGVIPSSFESELSAQGISSKRLGGKNRYETSVEIAKQVGNSSGEVSIVSGLDFADGLSISSVAATRNMPILLTEKNQLPSEVLNYLNGLNTSKTYIIGSSGAVSDNVASKLSKVERLGGKNRYETNKNIFNKFKSSLNLSNLYIASGLDFPDALSVSALAGKNSGFVVLSNLNSAEPDVKELMKSIRPNLDKVYVLGSRAIISDSVLYNLGINIIK
ncbi:MULTISPECIES: cell wall-binding repeat-containing protein [Clostridium]|uniref:cell wall-binding repeat-containing protein n=1 Tax=Clostridium sp. 7_2_43FAA TaxID=457396 RepID=UPI0002EF98D8|nr:MULTISPECIES: cell wall-binding repeat-containing protein [Clostridium]MBP1868386.1 N-acetylmuramoyl-L-alanine amidase/putative cell wall-binding protein [Clostridium tertium]